MTWKSTALVSAVSVLAAWLGTAPSPVSRSAAPSPVSSAPRVRAPAADIQQQAAHLQSRLRAQADYIPPARNPFRFGEAPVTRPRIVAPPPVAPLPAPVLPAAPPFGLAGIGATDTAGTMAYTAVLSTPSGVELAHAGDVVSGGWHIDAVDENGITVSAADGRTQRLSLKP